MSGHVSVVGGRYPEPLVARTFMMRRLSLGSMSVLLILGAASGSEPRGRERTSREREFYCG